MPAATRLVRCTLRDADGGGMVIVPKDACVGVLLGEEKGEPTLAETTNWQTESKTMLEQRLASFPAGDSRRATFNSVIQQIARAGRSEKE